MQTSHLMHLLICLSYLKEYHSDICETQCQFSDQISIFVEKFSQKPTSQNENDEIDKRTVLDLCAHMFHSQIQGGQQLDQASSSQLEYNDMRTEDKIKEFEND